METTTRPVLLPEDAYSLPNPLKKSTETIQYESKLSAENEDLEQSIGSFTDVSREKAAAIAITLDAILTRLDLAGTKRFSANISASAAPPPNTRAVISYKPGSLNVRYVNTTNDGLGTDYIVHTTGEGTVVKRRPIRFMSAFSMLLATISIVGATQLPTLCIYPFIFPWGAGAVALSIISYLDSKTCATTKISQLSSTDATTFLSYLYATPPLIHQVYEETVGKYAVSLRGDLNTLALKTAAIKENLRTIKGLHV